MLATGFFEWKQKPIFYFATLATTMVCEHYRISARGLSKHSPVNSMKVNYFYRVLVIRNNFSTIVGVEMK